ncbi:GntR family transcriptional regulator [Pontibacter cellulosilyticus]|uniref:GntR family transcriptional regulator n=1 Tax=Pontibacter cellulosilyticus TaxID=1720253 RepID=A0A923N8M6_9BACT|nr:GntR family transcriptional regulator [Pontibacter cellulosilyticus]MBC5994828.1 GntR family transcriptional regulator [Pontibacter cellulosilyticus]
MEFKENQAIYLQIANRFFENILRKVWTAGDKIPSIRDMAVEFEVNPNTTMRTFNYLQDKGVIYNKRGVGYFLADDGLERTIALKKEQFLEEELPAFLRTMKLLGLSLDDLKLYAGKYNAASVNQG